MLEFVMCVVEALKVMNEYSDLCLYHALDINSEITANVINELNNRQLRHWPELSYRDRASLVNNALYYLSRDPNANIGQQFNDLSPDIRERRLIAEYLSNSRLITEHNANVLANTDISDPRSDLLRAASQRLCARNFTYVRGLVSNTRVASQLQNCSTRASSIATHVESFQDSID